MSWSGKNETSRKSLVSWKLSIIQRLVDRERTKLDTYSCKCINFGRSKTRAFFKNMEKFILSLDQIVRWVMGSFEFLTWDYFFFFVRWLNSRGVSYQGQWSVVPLYDRDGPGGVFLVPERRSRSPMLYLKLNVLSCLGCFWRHLCSDMDKVESRCSCNSAPFPDFGLVISMMKNWFT